MKKSAPTILQVLPSLVSGGVERGTIETARAIRDHGWNPLIASAGGRLEQRLRHAGAQHITLPLKSKNPFTMYRNRIQLEDVMKEHKVSLVHARSRAPAWSAHIAARALGIPFVTTFHGTYGLQSHWKQKYNSIMVRGDRVIAISQFIYDHIVEHYSKTPDFSMDKIRLIHRGVDIDTFNPAMVNPLKLAELANQWRIPEDYPVVMLPGRITRWKGHDVLIRALHALPHRQFFCVFIGDDSGSGHYRAEMENLIMDLGLGSHVRFVGHTDHVPTALMMAHVIVAPSTEPEAFGRTAVEAQAMERPIIAANHGGARETVLHNETGWLVEPGNIEDLSAALDKALSMSFEERVEMGVAGRNFVCEHFTTQKMCSKTLAVYEELIKA